MKIIVLGHELETTEISAIYDIEKDKTMFLNREAGFVIKFRDGRQQKEFKEDIPYETYTRDIVEIKAKWRKLQELVTNQWEANGSEIVRFDFSGKST